MTVKLTSNLIRLFLQRYYVKRFKKASNFDFNIERTKASDLFYYRAESKWKNMATEDTYQLKTYRAIGGPIVTLVNGRPIAQHETDDSSMMSILKLHLSTLRKVLALQEDPKYKYL